MSFPNHIPVPAVPPGQHPSTSYDAVPYSVNAFPQTNPDRLAVIAALFGLAAADPRDCRVLELGCASGGNLIALAIQQPHSRFVGIDLSPRQIDDGQAAIRELGLHNVDLRCMSIADAGPDLGHFDYILAHGVYSWVPPEVQDKLLAVAANNLAPRGVAYVSYNTYPGWHARAAIREMLWYHTQAIADPMLRVQQARALLAFLTRSVSARDEGYAALMGRELATLARTPDSYLLHEHLEDFNEPLYFHQFMDRAAAKGLQYLAEAQLAAMVPSRLGADVEKTLRQISTDLLHMEQYMDFIRNRMFRQTLLCHADLPLDHALRAHAVAGFHVASLARPVAAQPDLAPNRPEDFLGPGQTRLTTQDPVMKAAMVLLAEAAPAALAFPELLAAARERLDHAPASDAARASAGHAGEGRGAAKPAATMPLTPPANPPTTPDDAAALSTRLLHCYVSQFVEFSLSPPRFVAVAGERPVASPYARLLARRSDRVINLRLESILLGHAARLVLQNLDGHHDRQGLITLLTTWMESQPAKPAAPGPAPAQPAAATPDSVLVGGPADCSSTAPGAPPAASPHDRAALFVNQVLPIFARFAFLIA